MIQFFPHIYFMLALSSVFVATIAKLWLDSKTLYIILIFNLLYITLLMQSILIDYIFIGLFLVYMLIRTLIGKKTKGFLRMVFFV